MSQENDDEQSVHLINLTLAIFKIKAVFKSIFSYYTYIWNFFLRKYENQW